MERIEEVTVFSLGDSTQPSTWSNVPYLFTRTLEGRGVRVNRVDLAPGLVGRLCNVALRGAMKMLMPASTYDYSRSGLRHALARRTIAQAVQRFPRSDVNIFLTFSFSSAGLSKQPTVLFGDWTYQHCVSQFRGREPDPLERRSIERENREIERADCVFVLFPSVAARMKQQYRNPHIHYAGNVVNAMPDRPARDLLALKAKSNALLFIGKRTYIEGARRLLAAYALLKPDHPELTVDIVGMTERELGPLPPGVCCYGYLDKGVAQQRATYYRLIEGARCIVNTTPVWSGFSAMIEAMHFHTPVVVTPYEEFVQSFGRDIRFGAYCADEPGVAPERTLARHLGGLLADDGYLGRCRAAHDAVAGYGWEPYIDRLLDCIVAISQGRRTDPMPLGAVNPVSAAG